MTSKIFFALLSTFALLCACSAELAPASPADNNTVRLTVICGEPQTKTFIVQDNENEKLYHANWTKSDILGVFVDSPVSSASAWSGTLVNNNESGPTASFGGSLSMTTGVSHTLNCVYPSSSFQKVYTNGSVGVKVPSLQNPTITSFDPAADILVAKPYDITPETGDVTITDMRFARVMSILKIVPKAASEVVAYGDKVQSLNLTAPVDLVGTAKVNISTGEIEGYVGGSTDITALYSVGQPVIGEDAIYLVVEPQTISAGSQLTFDITTDKHYIKKTVTIPSEIEFEQGNVTVLNLSVTDEHCSEISGNTKTDVIKASMLSATSNTYTAFDGVKSVSSAEYAGTTSKESGAIHLNNSSSKSVGIVSTSSGGKVSEVSVTWNTIGTYGGTTVNVYGSNTAYAGSSALYSESTRGTLIGSITKPATSVSSADGYKYVGIITDGYVLLDQISITWNTDTTPTCEAPVISCIDGQVQISCATSGASVYYTSDGTAPYSGSTLYDGIFSITSDVTIKAIAVKSGYADSSVSSKFCQSGGSGGTGEPALGKPWLELPAASSESSYYCYTHYATMNGSTQRNYSLLYDPATYTSYWVAYPICAAHLSTGRSGDWGYDNLISKDKQTDVSSGYGVSISTTNYPNNYYSRGHQIPNADRSGVSEMQSQTFVSTNSTPQIQNGFNGGIWANLETAVREQVPSSDTLYVVTGASFSGATTLTKITNSNDKKEIPVPTYYWKVLLKVKRDTGGNVTSASTIGFWLPHKDLKDENYTSYACSVDTIEGYTGFDFFVNLGDTFESAAESNTSWSDFCSF